MAQTIHFNTGRKYTVHGQRITATLHEDKVVTFFDHDRMVHGEFKVADWRVRIDKDDVMAAYDRVGQYEGTSRAWADGMQRGGVNSKYEEGK